MRKASGYVLIALTLAGSAARAQMNDVNFQGVTREGFHLYEISAFSSYTSSAYPITTTNTLSPGAAQLGYNINYGVSGGVGWQYTRDKVTITVGYTGTYNQSENYSSLTSFGHSLRANASWKLTPKWGLTFSGSGQYETLAQYLFEPTGLATVNQTSSSFNDLAAAMGVGNFSSTQAAAQLGGIATGALAGSGTSPISPSASLLIGIRLLTYAAQTSLNYQATERLSLFVSGVTAAGENRFPNANGTQQSYAIPHSIGLNGGLGVDYSLTPRTNVGFGVTESRISNVYQTAYTTQAMASIGRKMGTHWFLRGSGGGSYSSILQQQSGSPSQHQFIGSGSVGYQLAAQSFVAAYNRSSVETDGFAVGTNSTAGGSWMWRRRGSNWSLTAGISDLQLNNTGFVTLSGWTINGGAVVHLPANIAMNVSYAYSNSSGNYLGTTTKLTVNTVRLTLGWVPQWQYIEGALSGAGPTLR